MKEMQAMKIRRAYGSSAFIYRLPKSPFPSPHSWVITAGQHRCLPAWEQVPRVWRGWAGLSQHGLADGLTHHNGWTGSVVIETKVL